MVIETLQGLIDEAEDTIIRMNERIAECERVTKRCQEVTAWCRQATSNYEEVVENTRKIYKPSVYTYSDIFTYYPTPQIGWTVTVKETKIVYRWDGFEWVDIGTSEVYEGFNILLSATEPFNANYIWYKDASFSPEKNELLFQIQHQIQDKYGTKLTKIPSGIFFIGGKLWLVFIDMIKI